MPRRVPIASGVSRVVDCAGLRFAVREGGRTIPAALSEVREAVDFLRYYAARARAEFGAPQRLPGPTGEHNEIALHGRGVFACIAPWNFPLAILTGMTTAALVALVATVVFGSSFLHLVDTPSLYGQNWHLQADLGFPLPGG